LDYESIFHVLISQESIYCCDSM